MACAATNSTGSAPTIAIAVFFINPPMISSGPRRATLCKCRPDIRLQPHLDAGANTSLAYWGGVHISHHCYEISVAQPVGDVPANAQFNDLALEPPAAVDRVASSRLGHSALRQGVEFYAGPANAPEPGRPSFSQTIDDKGPVRFSPLRRVDRRKAYNRARR